MVSAINHESTNSFGFNVGQVLTLSSCILDRVFAEHVYGRDLQVMSKFLTNFTQTAYLLKSFNRKTNQSESNKFLKNSLIFLVAATISKLRLFKSFYPLEICVASLEICLVAKKTLQGLKKSFSLSKTKPLQSFSFALIHIASLATNIHKLNNSIYDPFTIEAISDDRCFSDTITNSFYRKTYELHRNATLENSKALKNLYENFTIRMSKLGASEKAASLVTERSAMLEEIDKLYSNKIKRLKEMLHMRPSELCRVISKIDLNSLSEEKIPNAVIKYLYPDIA